MASNTTSNSSSSCPKTMSATSNGIFQGDNPIHFELPLLIIQVCLVLLVTRTLSVILKPLRQPRVIAEIIVSLLLQKQNHQFLNFTWHCLSMWIRMQNRCSSDPFLAHWFVCKSAFVRSTYSYAKFGVLRSIFSPLISIGDSCSRIVPFDPF